MRITLESNRLRLRPFEETDAQAMFDNWASDPEVTKYLTWPTHQSVETTRRVLGEWLPLYEKPEYLNFGIELKETGRLVGNIAVVGYLEDRTLPVIGYNISRALWNQGYMTEACQCLLDYLFAQGFEKVRIDADVRNTASQRVIEKCGGLWFDTAEDERPLKGDTVMTRQYYVTKQPCHPERSEGSCKQPCHPERSEGSHELSVGKNNALPTDDTSFIWLGINVDEQLSFLWEPLKAIEQQVEVSTPLSLPFHISLKISFPVDSSRAEELAEAVEAYYRHLSPFTIPVKGIEHHDNIVWIRMAENETLNRIHNELNDLLQEKFGVGLHEYDRDYLFHTTLFMDEDSAKMEAAYQAIKDVPMPAVLEGREFLIGCSDSGEIGTYRVVKRIPASDFRYDILQWEEEVPEENAYLSELLELSRIWAEEKTCPSYSANEADEYEGKIIAVCREQEKMVGYAMGHVRELKEKTSYNQPGEKCFELDEVYVLPAYRSQGVGKVLAEKLTKAVQGRVDLMAVTAVSYRYKDLLRFYIEELGLDFKYALLAKRMD